MFKPPLKWAGGKRWLVPILRPIWQRYHNHRLVEPFCGGLGMALGLMPHNALLNDINLHVINFYQQMQQGLTLSWSDATHNNEATFYANRERFNQLIAQGTFHTAESARLFYYLNRTGFNGLCRFNSKGFFNVPFGRYKKINYMMTREAYAYQAMLARWSFQAGDFEQMVLQDSDFIYADPPYDMSFTQYAKEKFAWDDQVRLVAWLSQHKGAVVLSNRATARICELYADYGFTLTEIDAPRRISCDGNRDKVVEIIATRNIKATIFKQ